MERLTKRDMEILRYVTRVGVAQPTDLMTRFDVSRATAYRRLKLLSDLGHLSRERNLSPSGDVFIATRLGIARSDLPLRVPKVSSWTLQHSFAMTDVVGRLERAGLACMTEREVLAHKRVEESNRYVFPLLRPKIRWANTHRPDIVCEVPGHDVFVAIEVELSPKENDRWDDILHSYANRVGFDGFVGVLYLVGPGAESKRLKRRAEYTSLNERFQLVKLEDPKILAGFNRVLIADAEQSRRRAA